MAANYLPYEPQQMLLVPEVIGEVLLRRVLGHTEVALVLAEALQRRVARKISDECLPRPKAYALNASLMQRME